MGAQLPLDAILPGAPIAAGAALGVNRLEKREKNARRSPGLRENTSELGA